MAENEFDPKRPDRTWRRLIIRLPHLASLAEGTTIREWIFEGCRFEGPLIFALSGLGHIEGCRVYVPPGATVESALYEVSAERMEEGMVGAVILEGCVFELCEFSGIGFIGVPGNIALLREGLETYS